MGVPVGVSQQHPAPGDPLAECDGAGEGAPGVVQGLALGQGDLRLPVDQLPGSRDAWNGEGVVVEEVEADGGEYPQRVGAGLLVGVVPALPVGGEAGVLRGLGHVGLLLGDDLPQR